MRTGCTMTKNGDLKISSDMIKKIGIKNVNDLKFVYDEQNNEIEIVEKGNSLNIPDDMLEEAGIPINSNLVAFCREGEIVIKQDDEDDEKIKTNLKDKKIDENYVPEYVKAIIATLDRNPDIKIIKLNL